ncbi:MAG: thioesterase family protein [Acidimicrobiales bacterium]
MGAQIPAGLFEREGDVFHPSEFTRGPWRADAQHGGPPSALLARLTEPQIDDRDFLAHIEVELTRPVPLAPLRGEVRSERVSGRVSRIHGTLLADGEVVARSNALVLRESVPAEPEWSTTDQPAVGTPDTAEPVDAPRWASGDRTTYHRNGVEHRFTAGSFRDPGPAVDWVRLRQPLVVGEATSGLQRVLAAADFGSGISALYGASSSFGMINANLTVSIWRPVQGEWVSLDAQSRIGPQGTGLGVTQLGDVHGPVGVATQSLLGYDLG